MEISMKTCFLLLIPVSVVYAQVTTPEPPPVIFDNCVEAHLKTCNTENDLINHYTIKSRNTVGYQPTQCFTAAATEHDCSGIGWTYIGQLIGTAINSETDYDSAIWTAKGESQTVFNSQFWSANVTEVCLYSLGFRIQFPIQAPSLRSLFFENITLEIPVQQWLDGIKIDVSHLNFTNTCFKSGFNVGDPNHVRARLGIVSVVPHEGCDSAAKAMGIGIKIAGAGPEYGSVHGLYANTTGDVNDVSYQSVGVLVRSRPDPSEMEPTT